MNSSAGTVQFRLLGVPVAVRASFWLVAIALGAGAGRPPSAIVVWVAVLFVSVVVHELGHATAFRAYGYTPRIVLHAMGGATAPLTPRLIGPARDIVITLAGPAAGLALGAAVLALAATGVGAGHSLLEAVLTDALWATFGLSALNLVPILPLDGGRVLLSGLQSAAGGRGETAALSVSVLTATTAAAVALSRGWWWVGLVAVLFAAGNAAALSQARRRTSGRSGDDLIAEGHLALEQGAYLAAANRGREALATQADPESRWAAAHLLVWAALLDGRLEEGAEAMAALPPDAGSPILADGVVRAAGGLERAIDTVHQAFEVWPTDATGMYVVRVLLEADRLDEAAAVLAASHWQGLGPGPAAVVGAALFRAGRLEEAARVAEESFFRQPHPMLAYNAACCWARQGRLDDALAWLSRAIAAGYADQGELDADPDLAAVRALPGYGELRRHLTP